MDKLAKELPAELTYHSLSHIEDVYDAAKLLAREEGISDDDTLLLLTAVLFHDSGFTRQQKDHELISCEIARQYLPEYGYTLQQITRIEGMIMATQVPQTPHNLLEQIICDADLDYLGRDDFYTIGNRLFEELKTGGIVQTSDDWDRLQVRFLEKHSYFTTTANRLRKDKKEAYLRLLREKTGQ